MFTPRNWRVLDTLRQPAYTGENRCLPCTAVNVVLAVGIAVAVGAVWPPLGAAALLLSLASIYLRGYLVPGTPTLTKRYLPASVLAKFGKATETERTDRGADGPRLTTEFGAESRLVETGALARVDGNEAESAGTALNPAFRSEWLDSLDSDGDPTLEDGVRAVFGPEATGTPVGDGLTATVDGERLVGWESTAALRADVAAADLLTGQWDDWNTVDGPERQRLLSTLRAYLDRCPDCGGDVELTDTRRESCCRPAERAVTAACVDCDATLLDVSETV